VVDAEARVVALNASATDVKQRLNALEAQTGNLHDLAHPSPTRYGVEALLRTEVYNIDRLLHAVDVWTSWAQGRPVAVSGLTDAADIPIGETPTVTPNHGDVDRSQWIELLDPLLDLFPAGPSTPGPDSKLEAAGADLGLEL
jgi:hypothetical protein